MLNIILYIRNRFVFLNDFDICMRKIINFNTLLLALLLPVVAMSFVACDDEVSYSDMKEKEAAAIREYIKSEGIAVIDKETFLAQDSITNINNNEYVLLDDIYIQFVCNPKGKDGARKIEEGEKMNLVVKFTEYNIQEKVVIRSNEAEAEYDLMTVENTSGTYQASFLPDGVMYESYGTSAVPTGWLVAMPYLYFTRSQSSLAAINIIVPHTHGTSVAATYVYPCFYKLIFQPE